MLLSLLVHGGLAVGFMYVVHGHVGGARYTTASPMTVVTLIDAQKENILLSKLITSTDGGAKEVDVDTHLAHVAATAHESEAVREQADLLPQVRGSGDVDTISTFNLIALPKPYYFQPSELTEQPVVVVDVSPDLSAVFSSGLSQLAVLDLLINESGDIDDVIMENSSLAEPAQQLIKNAFSKTKFNPGKVAGMPVKSQLKIEVVLEGVAVENIAKKRE